MVPKPRPPSADLADPVALIPAAGSATRLGKLPCSKEIYPIAVEGASGTPRPACSFLLEALAVAGIRTALMVLRPDKWDIPECLAAAPEPDISLAYVTIEHSPSVPHTLDRAYAFVRGRRVALGWPDILFRPRDAYTAVLERQEATGADVMLGLFTTAQPWKVDLVDVDSQGRVRGFDIKRPESPLTLTWAIAVWQPCFSDYLHAFLAEPRPFPPGDGGELYLGHVLERGIADGLRVEAVPLPGGACLDIGTPVELRQAGRWLADDLPG